MRATNLLLLGTGCNRTDWARQGLEYLKAWVNYTAAHGISEFDSPTCERSPTCAPFSFVQIDCITPPMPCPGTTHSPASLHLHLNIPLHLHRDLHLNPHHPTLTPLAYARRLVG